MNGTSVSCVRSGILALLVITCLGAVPVSVASERDVRNRIALGALAFAENCQRCHQADGYGEEALYPSLHDSRLLENRVLLIRTIIDGRNRHLEDGPEKTPLMPSLAFLTDAEIAAIIAFISNSWGEDVLMVSEAEVAAARRRD